MMRLIRKKNIFIFSLIIFPPVLLAGMFFVSRASASSMNVSVTVSTCNSNGVCDSGENISNCPNECGAGGGGGDIIPPTITPTTTPPITTTTPATTSPLIISSVVVSNISDVGASIAWQTNRSAICELAWGINSDYSGGAGSEISYLSDHTSQLTALSPNTTYHYNLNCHDSANISSLNGDAVFKTLKGADLTPPGNVSGLRSLSGNGTSTLFWKNPADPDFAGVVIKRSTSYYPNLTQGAAVYDGQGELIGNEFSFTDAGLDNDNNYYYSVFAYDTSRNYSSGVGTIARPHSPSVTPIVTPTTTTPPYYPPAPEVPLAPGGSAAAADLFFSDFAFSQQGRILTVQGDQLTADPDSAITVLLFQAKVLPNTKKIVLNLSVEGKIQTIIFAYNPDQKSYSAGIDPISSVGVYYATIIALNADNQSLKTIAGSIEIKSPTVNIQPSLPQTVNSAVNTAVNGTVDTTVQISNAIREAPAVKAIAKVAATPAAQSAAVASVAASFASTAISIPLFNWWFLLQFLFTQPLRLFWFRKGWGTVYNSITKKPVDLALVRLYDAKTNRLITSRVTDKNGRYIFLVNPGEYFIKVEKPGFDYPSVLLKLIHDDGSFLDLYYGERINVAGDERSAIIANIPLDQQDAELTDAEALKKYSRARLSQSLSWLGPLLAVGYYLFYPSYFSGALIVVHLLVLYLFRRLAGRRHKKHWGVVYGPDGKNPIKKAVTRIFSAEYGRMLEFYVTDDRGRYDFLVGNNKYYVTADKSGFGTARTPELDLTGKKPKELAITQDLILPKLNQDGSQSEQTAENMTQSDESGKPPDKSNDSKEGIYG